MYRIENEGLFNRIGRLMTSGHSDRRGRDNAMMENYVVCTSMLVRFEMNGAEQMTATNQSVITTRISKRKWGKNLSSSRCTLVLAAHISRPYSTFKMVWQCDLMYLPGLTS